MIANLRVGPMVQLGITLKDAVGTTNAYGQDVGDGLVQLFSSSGLGRQLLHSIYTRVNPGADKQRLNHLLRWPSDAQCSPEEAVALLLDLGIPRRRLRFLSRFISKRAEVWYKQTGLTFGKPMPRCRRVNLAWKGMKDPLHLVRHIDKETGIRNALLPDLGIPRRRLRVLSRFFSKRAEVWCKQTGLRFGKPMPRCRRVNLAWKEMKDPLHLVRHIDKETGIRDVSWPFDHWIN